MKNSIFIFIFIFILINLSNAAILRVNNSPYLIGVPYTSISAAYNAASNGDTIYLEGSLTSYGNLTLTKPLTIFGPGYFLNSQTSYTTNEAILGDVNFNPGSSGSLISGLVVNLVRIYYTGNISVIKNYITTSIVFDNQTVFGNIIISQNWLIYGNGIYSLNQGSNYINNISILNNYLNGQISLSPYYSGIISNNCIVNINYVISVYNFVITNNITCNSVVINYGNNFSNNIGTSTQFPVTNNNQQNIAFNNIFVGGSADTAYHVIPHSAAYHAGTDSTDCGMFGGSYEPYIPSGFPPIPEVYGLIVPGSSRINYGMNITVKAKSH